MLRVLRASVILAVVLGISASDALGARVIHRDYDHSAKVFAGRVRVPGSWAVVVGWPFIGGGPITLAGAYANARGRYRVNVPRGTTRTLTLWVAHRVQTVVEDVSPSLWIFVSSRRNGRVRFTGGEQVAPFTPLATVVVQAYAPGVGWRTFGAVNPNPYSHLWRFTYRPGPGEIGRRFLFRAASLSVPLFYVRGTSRPRWATIR